MWQIPPLRPEEILDYLRKSQSDDPTLTIEEVLEKHEHMLDDWVERNMPGAGKVPEENRIREVVSGETIDSRPGMLDLLRRIESPKIKAVLVVEPQRLSRGSLKDIGRLVELLRYSNTIVITMQYIYDLRDDRDREAFERELMRGNDYLEYYKRIMHNGRITSLQAGNFIGNRAPYGYRIISVKEGKKTCYTLDPVQDEVQIVKMIFEWYAAGTGVGAIIDRLYELKIAPKTGAINDRWGPTTIRTILSNEHYIGKVRWFHKKTVKTVKDGEVITRRPTAEDYLVYPGKHPAIIDQELWDKVQARRGTFPRNKKAANFANVFSGLLFCECGRAMKRHAYVVNGKERATARLQCPDSKICGNASCMYAEMIDIVKGILRDAIEDFEIRIEASEDSSEAINRQLVERMERRLEKLEALEVSQWEKYTQEGMPKHIFEQLNAKVLQEKAEVQEALCTAKGAVTEPVALEEKVSTFYAALAAMEDPDAPAKEVNMLLKECIERITYSRPRTPSKNPRANTSNPITVDVKLRV